MKRRFRKVLPLVAFTAMIGVSGAARAQGTPTTAPPPAPAPATATGEAGGSVELGGSAQGTSSGAMTLPQHEEPPPPAAAAPAPRRYVAPGDSDHAGVVGTFGIGYLGMRSIAVGTGGGDVQVAAPVIGLRYWLTDLIGIDAGIGLGIVSRGGDNIGPQRSDWGFILHGGVPLALATAGHFTFEVIPEMNLGFGGSSQDVAGGGGTVTGHGFHFDIGARAGAEIQFGFIGIPNLSLQGTIGLAVATETTSVNAPGGGPEPSRSTTSFGTSVQDSPWNIFTSNVAALYYF